MSSRVNTPPASATEKADQFLLKKAYQLLTPKYVCIDYHFTQRFPNKFERVGGIYVGPKEGFSVDVTRQHTILKRISNCDSKWFHRASLLEFPTHGGGYLFNSAKYEKFICSKRMWTQLPQLYGRIIGCQCAAKCCCQVSVLKWLLQQRMKKDFPYVEEKRYGELKQQYSLNGVEKSILVNLILHPRCTPQNKSRYVSYLKQG